MRLSEPRFFFYFKPFNRKGCDSNTRKCLAFHPMDALLFAIATAHLFPQGPLTEVHKYSCNTNICSRDLLFMCRQVIFLLRVFIYLWHLGCFCFFFLRESFWFWWKNLPLHDGRCVDVELVCTFVQCQQEKDLKSELPSTVQAAGAQKTEHQG